MFLRRFSTRSANRGWHMGRPNGGQSLFLEPIGKWLRKLGPNLVATAKSAVRRYQDMRLEDFEAVKPFENRWPTAQAAAITDSIEISQDLHVPDVDVDMRNSEADRIDTTDGSLSGQDWLGSDGNDEIQRKKFPRNEAAACGTAADGNSGLEVAAGPWVGNSLSLESEEEPDDKDTSENGELPTSRKENMSPTRLRTMVESLLKTTPGGEETIGYLPEGLADIFVKKEVADPRVQALLRGLERLDCQELADELREFVDGIGANSVCR